MRYESRVLFNNVHVVDRCFTISGHEFMIRVFVEGRKNADDYQYYLPDGRTFTHPSHAGCYIACMQWLEDNME